MLTEQDSRHPILVRSTNRKRIAWQFRELHFTPTHQATCQLCLRTELKQDLSRQRDLRRVISQTQSASLVILSGALSPETGHVNSSA